VDDEERATSQAMTAVRRLPTCNGPVGLGANRPAGTRPFNRRSLSCRRHDRNLSAMSGGSGDRHGDHEVQVGAHVAVWNEFLGRWSGPFEVVGVSAAGCQVRRPGDRDPLPQVFRRVEPVDPGAPGDGWR
jgi:hypothetical protein